MKLLLLRLALIFLNDLILLNQFLHVSATNICNLYNDLLLLP